MYHIQSTPAIEVDDGEERPRGFGVVVPEEDCSRHSDSDFGVSGDGEKSAMARRDHVDLGSSYRTNIDSDWLTPFKKNFYVESREVAVITEEEVEEYRVKREIIVEVKDVPRPVKSFEDIGFPDYVMEEIKKAGFVIPTPIRAQGWLMALKGRDLIGIAETGSGKTLAYLLPAIVHVNAQPFLGKFEH
ncbi:hypothetical protein Droror1_Dr00007829 [Drosera rotundifolia]